MPDVCVWHVDGCLGPCVFLGLVGVCLGVLMSMA